MERVQITDTLANRAKNPAKNTQEGLTATRSSHSYPQPRRLWPLALLMPRREEGLRLMERQAVESEDPAAASQVSTAPVWLFAATLFVSATLLFWIQPLFAKMVLPLLGGSPSVWNTAMVFSGRLAGRL